MPHGALHVGSAGHARVRTDQAQAPPIEGARASVGNRHYPADEIVGMGFFPDELGLTKPPPQSGSIVTAGTAQP